MGQPERIRTLPCHEIEKIVRLSLRENEMGGPLPRDCVDYQTEACQSSLGYFFAPSMCKVWATVT